VDLVPEGDWRHITCKLAGADNQGISVAALVKCTIGADASRPQ